ncbi:MAG TPA: GMC family oxidoreductase [Chryseosolibacter sp.]|nr:GMC family oxidoreductase [Chryseosolibacter sp.]
MHTDARTLENNSVIEGDVCIIGAGVAGITLALQFVNTRRKVILLEGGGFDVDMEMQELYRGKSIGQRYYPLQSARLHYFGGTSGHWGGFCSTLDPIDFHKREWVPYSEWPIQYSDLFPYYRDASRLVELPTSNFDLEYWRTTDPELIPLPFNEKVVKHKMLQFSPPTRFGKTYRDAIVEAGNIFLYTHAKVVDIRANELVTNIGSVKVKNMAGKEHVVKAKYFVAACSAMHNARLLLASDTQAKKGLGNDRDLVGRFFMDHLEMMASEIFLQVRQSVKLYRPWVFRETKARAELRLSDSEQSQLQILNATAALMPNHIAETTPANINSFSSDAEGNVKGWDVLDRNRPMFFQRWKKEKFRYKHFSFFTRLEQSPNPDSRVTLDGERDALGMRRVILNWKLTDLEKRSLRSFHEAIGLEAGRSEVGRVKLMEWLLDERDHTWPDILGGGWHNIGTTRMADSPSKGVVDQHCRVYGIDNLFMAGSSCFPTSGSANPTLTIIALTLRLSDHLKSLDFTNNMESRSGLFQ